jgi:hypothetical protein
VKCVVLIIFVVAGLNLNAQILGCTDPLATNFNSNANQNDGSCLYPNTNVNPIVSWDLPATAVETSGLLYWAGALWTHNDNSDINLYSIDTLSNPATLSGFNLGQLSNYDWEDIDQDSLYLYLGDVGNNGNGNRTDLKFYRIAKNSIITGNPEVDTILFSYATQTDFSGTGANNSDYDCEAFIVKGDSIYLFTKEWVANQSRLFVIPKSPGSYTANFISQFNVQGLITGAVYHQNPELVTLCGYTETLQPFAYLLYDFDGNDFFNGNKRRLGINLLFHQIEGITTTDGLSFFMSNEKFQQSILTTDQKLHRFDLSPYLETYFTGLGLNEKVLSEILIYPNPAEDEVVISCPEAYVGKTFSIFNSKGELIESSTITSTKTRLSISNWRTNLTYFLSVENSSSISIPFMKE